MDRRETERIVAAIRTAHEAGTRVALATVVRVKGNAYRREGARIAVGDDGTYVCLLSGGCLEPAVADAAAHVIATGTSTTVSYDLADDSIWGLGIGCSGAVDVRIERIEDDPLTRAWLDILERGEAAVLITPLNAASGRLLVREGDTVGTLGDERVTAEAIAAARERLLLCHFASGTVTICGTELFFEVSEPPSEVVIFGAGPDAVPLARQARELGFVVTVVDPRAAMMTGERFPGAMLRVAQPDEYAVSVPLTRRSHVVVMNHHLERDAAAVRHAVGSMAPYVGVLGPRARYMRLVERLRRDGATLDARSLARVRNPIGLALGAETPEEIAVAILGELIALRRGFEGGFLSGREGRLHHRDAMTEVIALRISDA